MRKGHFFPLALLLFLPLWYASRELHGDLFSFFSLLTSSGNIWGFCIGVFSFDPFAISLGFIFYLFINYIAPKLSLWISSLILAVVYYLMLPAPFFYENLDVFVFTCMLCMYAKNPTSSLFYCLYYITLLHTFSCLLISLYFYGYNIPLFSLTLSPLLALFLLYRKNIYPSQITLLSLFPTLMLPISFFTHTPAALSFGGAFGSIVLLASIYTILEKRNKKLLVTLFTLSLVPFGYIEIELIFPFLFTPLSLAVAIMQISYASSHPRPSRRYVLPQTMQPSLPPLHFYNEHMHY